MKGVESYPAMPARTDPRPINGTRFTYNFPSARILKSEKLPGWLASNNPPPNKSWKGVFEDIPKEEKLQFPVIWVVMPCSKKGRKNFSALGRS